MNSSEAANTPPGDQPPPPPGGPGGGRRGRDDMMDPAQMVQRLDQALELTDDQKAKITDISKKQAEQMQALRDEMRAKMQDLEKARHDQIRALLTADQQKKFDAMPPPGRVVTDVVAAARVDPAATRHLHLLRPRHLRREDPLG